MKTLFRTIILANLLTIELLFAAANSEVPRAEIQRFEISIVNRQVVRDSNVIKVGEGDRVELTWVSDESVELHLHGYDIEVQVGTDAPAVMTFAAFATGRFPVTSHGFSGDSHGHDTVLYLEVHPR